MAPLGAAPSAALAGVAVDAVQGPRQSFQALRCDRLAALLAQPEGPGLDPPQRALDQAQVLFLALTELLAALALGDFGGRGGLGTMRDSWVLDLFGKLETETGALGFERLAGVFDQLRVHESHPTLVAESGVGIFAHVRGAWAANWSEGRRGQRDRLSGRAGACDYTRFVSPGRSRPDPRNEPPVRLKEHQMAFAKDPVCGMEVDTDTELKVEYDGETYYFCSRGCKLDFEEDPEKYLDPTYEPHM